MTNVCSTPTHTPFPGTLPHAHSPTSPAPHGVCVTNGTWLRKKAEYVPRPLIPGLDGAAKRVLQYGQGTDDYVPLGLPALRRERPMSPPPSPMGSRQSTSSPHVTVPGPVPSGRRWTWHGVVARVDTVPKSTCTHLGWISAPSRFVDHSTDTLRIIK